MNKLVVICMVFLFGVLADVSTAGSLIDNGNGTVTDSGTLLTWQKGESAAMTWEAALIYCEGLVLPAAGYTDWRLPNHKELLSLVDYTKATIPPAINTTLFPGAFNWFYWSSTTVANNAANAWFVHFGKGYSDDNSSYNGKTLSHYARCVRGGQ